MRQGELGIEAAEQAPHAVAEAPIDYVELIRKELYAAGFATLHRKWDAVEADRASAAAELRDRFLRVAALATRAAEAVGPRVEAGV